MKKLAIIAIIALSLTAMKMKDASAVLMETTITGTVTSASAGNVFGLDAGDTISGFACWDNVHLDASGDGIIEFGDPSISDPQQDPNHKLHWIVGTLMFDETDDNGYSAGFFPLLDVIGGNAVSIDYQTTFGSDDFFALVDNTFDSYGLLGLQLEGTLEFSTGIKISDTQQAPVPEPTTVMLLSIGILSLAGAEVRRRRKTKLEMMK